MEADRRMKEEEMQEEISQLKFLLAEEESKREQVQKIKMRRI